MKTTYRQQDIASFLSTIEGAEPNSLANLTEGHGSQAFSFEDKTGKKLVLRIADKRADFVADKYAADVFGESLSVPRVVDFGKFDGTSFYCITELASGKTTNILTETELTEVLPAIRQSLANTFTFDISATHGYGPIDTTSGNANHSSWRDRLVGDIEKTGLESYKMNAANIGIDTKLVDTFFDQYRRNLPCAPEIRRLIHGDPAFDNMLVENGKVTAVIDWAQMEYGDWACDYARLDFWWPGRYGDIYSFANEYTLEADNLHERVALYWAVNALWTIEFADKAQNEQTVTWLKEYLPAKIVQD